MRVTDADEGHELESALGIRYRLRRPQFGFWLWCRAQVAAGRQDPVGDLARDVREDGRGRHRCWPRGSSHYATLYLHLRDAHHAPPHALALLRDAWTEWAGHEPALEDRRFSRTRGSSPRPVDLPPWEDWEEPEPVEA